MLFVKVRKKDGERTRVRLLESNILSNECKIESNGEFLYFPVIKKHGEYEYIEMEGVKCRQKYYNLTDALSGTLSSDELRSLITSFDIIGDVAIIEIPDKLLKKQRIIAEAVMGVHKNVRVVAKKTGAMTGKYRVRPLKVIAGEKRTETTYSEFEMRMMLDPSKVYFSGRLSGERKRIANLVKDDENILALFAGVGPFPLVISKFKPKTNIVAIELNPHAIEYMKRNVKLNKINNIQVIKGDVRKIVPEKYANFADRILMPLPKNAEDFLDVALAGANNNCTVHIYAFAPVSNPYKAIKTKIIKVAKKVNAKVQFLNQKIVRPYAPNITQVVIDFILVKPKQITDKK
jgi:tRNA (guanine37-N1)-methyltransferase